jgi:Glycosyl hydrolases family 6
MRRGRWSIWLPGSVILGILLALGVPTALGHVARGHAASSYVCRDPHSRTRDPTNPLALPYPPGPDPLTGASFFVDGPRHGAAAGAIASLLGLNPMNFADDFSWAQFQRELSSGPLARRLSRDPALAYRVENLAKIASEPEAQRLSAFSAGGSPAGVYNQTIKILCHNLTADPGSIPILDTYFLHPALGGCATPAQVSAAGPLFRRRVDALARGIANRPAVVLLELDGIGSSSCFRKMGSLGLYERDLRYEAENISSLPHTVVYMEAGYSDANAPGYTARVLNAAGVGMIRGFWTNDTHLNWTIAEIKWGDRISRLTHGAHFVVNTAQNGNGPKRNPHPVTQGNEDLCNPPGRAMGPRPTADTGFSKVDAFVWSSPPGNSSGSCNGGPASGTFWAARAISLAARANGRLGPQDPSEPY